MNDRAPPTAAGRAGLARHLALDHNPLRRRTDRFETCIMAGLVAAFLAGRRSSRSPRAAGHTPGTCGSRPPRSPGIRFTPSCCKPRHGRRPSGTHPFPPGSGPGGHRLAGSPALATCRRRQAVGQAAGYWCGLTAPGPWPASSSQATWSPPGKSPPQCWPRPAWRSYCSAWPGQSGGCWIAGGSLPGKPPGPRPARSGPRAASIPGRRHRCHRLRMDSRWQPGFCSSMLRCWPGGER